MSTTISFAEIPMTRDLSLGTAMCSSGLHVKSGSAHARVYDDLIEQGLVEELDSGIGCFRVFRTTALGEVVYGDRFQPAIISTGVCTPIEVRP